MTMSPRINSLEPEGVWSSTFPRLVLGVEARRESANIAHDLVGGGVAVSLLFPRPRSGVMRLLYMDQAAAYEALALLSRRCLFFYNEDYLDPGQHAADMTFSVVGQGTSVALDATTRRRWLVDVEYQEVL